MKKNFDQKLNTYAAEYREGDRTHENEFMDACRDVVRITAYGKHFRFNDTDGRMKDDFDDLYQDTVQAGLANLASYNKEHPFSAWLSGICLNVYRKDYNDACKFEMVSLDEPVLGKDGKPCGWLGDTIDAGIDIEREYISADNGKRMCTEIQRLQPEQRRAMELCYLEGMKRDEAAAVMDVPRHQIDNYLTRGIQKAKKYCRESDIDFDL